MTKVFKCFIASPSDTKQQRDICDKVLERLNNNLGEQLNFRAESKKWEKNARPSFGKDGQDVINSQLLNDYQVFIGIMWNKFGTPTPRAGSGTEEEFLHAYNRYIKQEDVEILMYFNKEKTDPDSIDLEQLQKVRDFKEKVAELGGLFKTFEGTEEFEDLIYDNLHSYFVQKLGKNSGNEDLKDEAEKLKKIAQKETVQLLLNTRLENSLCTFAGQPFVWIDPIIGTSNEISENPDENFKDKVGVKDLIQSPYNLIIKAPPQFGLTSLSHYMIKEAWTQNKTWIYLDAKKVKRNAVKKNVEKELDRLKIEDNNIECIVLDEWIVSETGSMKLLKNLSSEFPNSIILVMQTIDDSHFVSENNEETIDRHFEVHHLLALPRTEIRKVVSAYNNEIHIGEENLVLNKVIGDLDTLNIHRTPLNCLTILKVSEKYFDESPVNRTKMLEMVLFVLFDLGEIPTYKSKPDLKDCEYVLGKFCAEIIKSKNTDFSRDKFLTKIKAFCHEKLIDLEVDFMFDILYNNGIITKFGDSFKFRASYWIYYFGAKRMHINAEFKDYIFEEKRYVSFPEIIEFYTGIDRNRNDALKILNADLHETREIVNQKIGLPKDFNPYQMIKWHPTEESIGKLKEDINDDVQKSNLPEEIKDQHTDKGYNQLKPYNQSIQTFFEEYSLAILLQKLKASSRALRNSDYAEPEIKRQLLDNITQTWLELSKVLFVITPVLATKGKAMFEGIGFIYINNKESISDEEKANRILQVIPSNVVGFFKNDVYSNKIGPLLFDRIENEKNSLIKHELILLLIYQRPNDWHKVVEDYIVNIEKDSFFLFNTINVLRTQYKYNLDPEKNNRTIGFLLKKGYAKHNFGSNNPTGHEIKKISNNVLPKRN